MTADSRGRVGDTVIEVEAPRTVTQWAVCQKDETEPMRTFYAEAEARRHWQRWLEHGEPVDLVQRSVTTTTTLTRSGWVVVEPQEPTT